jgi:hypothetical protein
LRSVETLEEIGDALVCGSFGRHSFRIGASPAAAGVNKCTAWRA